MCTRMAGTDLLPLPTPFSPASWVVHTGKPLYFTEMCSGSEAGSYLSLIDVCITQL